MTRDEVRAIQKTGIDWLGQPLLIDGVIGPKTKWWQGILTLDAKRQEVGRLSLGYHASNIVWEKTGRNDSDNTNMLFKPVGLQGKGYAWCIAYVSHCLRESGVRWDPYHISAWALIDWAKRNNRCVDNPLPFDIEVYLYPKVKGEDYKGHGRFITGYDPVTKVTAGVDGNANNTVMCGLRQSRPDRYFVRPFGFTSNHGELTMPKNLTFLDKEEDR